MSGKAVGWVFDWAAVENSTELLLLLAIADASHDDGCGCWESMAELAHKTRGSDRWVRSAIRSLETRGQIAVLHRRGRGNSNHYQLTMTNDHGQQLSETNRKGARHAGFPAPQLPPKEAAAAPFMDGEKGLKIGGKPAENRLKIDQPPHDFDDDPDPDPDPDPSPHTHTTPAREAASTNPTDDEVCVCVSETELRDQIGLYVAPEPSTKPPPHGREPAYAEFEARFRRGNDGHFGDKSAAGRAWFEYVTRPEHDPAEVLTALGAWFASPEYAGEQSRSIITNAATWLAKWTDWVARVVEPETPLEEILALAERRKAERMTPAEIEAEQVRYERYLRSQGRAGAV